MLAHDDPEFDNCKLKFLANLSMNRYLRYILDDCLFCAEQNFVKALKHHFFLRRVCFSSSVPRAPFQARPAAVESRFQPIPRA